MAGGRRRRDDLSVETRDPAEDTRGSGETRVPCLTILHHPVLARVGEEVFLPELERGQRVEISRVSPTFAPVGGGEGWPIADPSLSRRPVSIRVHRGGLEIDHTDGVTEVTIDGARLDGARRLPITALDEGVVIELSNRVIMLLHRRRPRRPMGDDLGLVGHSEGLERVRESILRVADLAVPVLIRGRTGTGKELVAAAIHRAGPRCRGPFNAVNLGALVPTLAASELFGNTKGAFSGATSARLGYFQRSDRGTLFLDEVGEAPVEVQVSLLRALETRRIQPVGDEREVPVDVRIVAATDADLTRLMSEERFRPALLQRLRGYEIFLPPLSARREDLGRLIVHFARSALIELGDAHLADVAEPQPRPWFPAKVARALIGHDWPGNVRELRNAVQQIVIANRGAAELAIDHLPHLFERSTPLPAPDGSLSSVEPRAAARPSSKGARRPAELTEDELIATLRRHRWRIQPAAKQLGISTASLHRLIEESSKIRRATDLSDAEIRAAREGTGGDVDAMAERLEVSARGLKLRLGARSG